MFPMLFILWVTVYQLLFFGSLCTSFYSLGYYVPVSYAFYSLGHYVPPSASNVTLVKATFALEWWGGSSGSLESEKLSVYCMFK